MTYRLHHIILTASILLSLAACSDTVSEWHDDELPDMSGEQIQFTTRMPSATASASRALIPDTELLTNYTPVAQAYTFSISMYEQGTPTPLDTKTYSPDPLHEKGELTSTAPLYWPTNVHTYGFEAVAGSETLDSIQNTPETWIAQDRLHGYSYEPLLTSDPETSTNTPVDNIDAINYRTNKDWYTANKTWLDQMGLSATDDYKRVPLFLQHERALITVILKAGEGVERNDVLAATADEKIATRIYSYDSDGKKTGILPLQGSETVDYDKVGKLPAETGVEVARYDAIVEPHNYMTKAEEEKICAINVSNQNFSFYASSDRRYGKDDELSPEEIQTYKQAYDLKAGDNLVITATLSRDSRKILITAYIQPWTDVVTSYVCDDFGSTGEPIIINSKPEFEAFLSDSEKNAAGNVAVLNSPITLQDWSATHDLNAILNLGGHTITTDSQIFNDIKASGSLINGNILTTPSSQDVNAFICQDNFGLIDHIGISNLDEDTPAVARRASIAVNNYSYISSCSSTIKVEGKAVEDESPTFIGGIAAISKASSSSMLPVINNCTVNARVCIADNTSTVYGGGIVGAADGYVINNTFEYGVTLNQELDPQNRVKNIIHTKTGNYALYATGNEWPTKTSNSPNGYTAADGVTTTIPNARPLHELFDKVIDCEAELDRLIEPLSSYNASDKSYRLSADFTILSDTWPLGKKTDDVTNAGTKNVLFTLDGNDMSITLDGDGTIIFKPDSNEPDDSYTPDKTAPMLFSNIMGTVKNLTLLCKESLYGIPVYGEEGTDGKNMSSDICAPLAYSVIGGTVRNVTVLAIPYEDAEGNTVYPKIVASIPSGLVTWACNRAVIENCISNLDVEMRLSPDFNAKDNTLFAGGIVAQAANATITQCKYVPREGYVFKSSYNSSNIFYGGIIGGAVEKVYSSGTKESPSITITDCSSWYAIVPNETEKTVSGSIIGRSYYKTQEQNNDGVNKAGCQGNWWPEGSSGVGTDGLNSGLGFDEKILGKKNSIVPNRPI